MDKRFLHKGIYLSFAIVMTGLIVYLVNVPSSHPSQKCRDYADIIQSGTLKATLEYNKPDYYIQGDSIVGFQYELLKKFAQHCHLKLEITPLMSYAERVKGLNNGDYDIIAYPTLSNSVLKDSLLLTPPLFTSRQVLVQRKSTSANDSNYIHTLLSLAKKSVYIITDSPIKNRLHHLMEEIGDTIYIKELPGYGNEQLISLVAHKDIPYAICDEVSAKKMAMQIDSIDYTLPISFNQFYGWAVSKHSPILSDTLNQWLNKYVKLPEYQELRKRYYTTLK